MIVFLMAFVIAILLLLIFNGAAEFAVLTRWRVDE
jgi:hypothetical protein